MLLRQELLPPNQDEPSIQRVLSLLLHVTALVDSGKPADREIAVFNAATGQDYDRFAFHNIESFTSYESFAAIAVAGRPPQFSCINDAEYIEIIRRLGTGEASEVESHYWLQLLETNLGCSEISDLLYWPKRQLSPIEILQEARLKPAALALP